MLKWSVIGAFNCTRHMLRNLVVVCRQDRLGKIMQFFMQCHALDGNLNCLWGSCHICGNFAEKTVKDDINRVRKWSVIGAFYCIRHILRKLVVVCRQDRLGKVMQCHAHDGNSNCLWGICCICGNFAEKTVKGLKISIECGNGLLYIEREVHAFIAYVT